MSMLLDKDKLRLLILTESTTCLPGQHVVGTLRVEVLKDVAVTAIRLLARGKESVSFKAKKGHSNVTREQSFVHFEHLITFFGFSKEGGRRGGASLAAGIYEYPFDITIPVSAPPSYHCRTPTGEAEIAYTLRATVDIPRGFDKKHEISLCVLSTIAEMQYDELSRAEKALDTRSVALAVEPGCCGRNKDPKASVSVSAAMPAVSLLQRGSGGGEVPHTSDYLIVRVRLTNTSRKTSIHAVRVTLSQHRRLMAQGDSCDVIQTLSTADASPNGGLIPRASASLEVRLRLPDSMRHLEKMPMSFPLPSMSTPCIETSNYLTISFPGLGADAVVNMSDATMIVAAVDHTSQVPKLPCSYTMATIRPEDKLGGE